MDPLSAFGLAVNVLSVVDISKSFLETLGQVKDAGSSAATRDIVSISRSLQASNAKIASQSLTTGDDEAFKDLVDECMNLSNELIDLGGELSVPSSGKLMTKVKITARTMWSHSKIQEKKARLGAIRGQLLFDIVVPMAAKIVMIPDTAAMDAQTRTLLDEIKAGEDANSAMEKRIRAFHEEYATVQAERHTEIVTILNDIRDSKPQPVTSATRNHNNKSKKLILRYLLNSLYYVQEVDRLYDIKPAHNGTFEWIYNEPQSGANRATWANFHDWLQNDSGIYWISGKAGSGKSTLMKLIGTDQRTRQPLLAWSAGSRLLILSHYFWNPGTPLQKSLEGLLRSIISQALKECPELAEKLFPRRFERYIDDRQAPTIQELERAFSFLTGQGLTDASQNPIRLVLFIDGLDEFDAGSMSLADLAMMFAEAAKSPSFKAVMSSRPENAFEEAFNNCPKLRLHFLTHNDVVHYVNDNLRNHPRMIQLIRQAPKESTSLVQEIVEAAQGVFLWVKVVVRSLLEGLRNHDELAILNERLRELPTDLEDLFRIMLHRVPRIYKQAMSKTFQLVRFVAELQARAEIRRDNWGYEMGPLQAFSLTALGLKFALLDANTVLQAETCQLSVKRAYEEISSIGAQIKASCSGLIELRGYSGHAPFDSPVESEVTTEAGKGISSAVTNDLDDPEIHFIHRSVKEYLSKEDVWNDIIVQAEKDFQPPASLLQGLVMQVKIYSYCVSQRIYDDSPWYIVAIAFEIAHTMEQEYGTDQLEMLNALETALTTRYGLEWWETYKEHSDRPSMQHDDFFACTVYYGLSRYVQSRLRSPSQQSIHKPGRPLLDYACRPPERVYKVWWRDPDARIVKALLQHGADPNKRFKRFSPWQNAWYTAWFRKDLRHRIVPILEALLAKGADPNAYIEFTDWRSKHIWEDRRLSVLLVALKFRKLWKVRRGVHIYAEDDDENSDEVQEEDDEDDDIEYDASNQAICSQGIRKLIGELRNKGARSREWRKVKGVYLRQKSSSSGAQGEVLRGRTHCVLL